MGLDFQLVHGLGDARVHVIRGSRGYVGAGAGLQCDLGRVAVLLHAQDHVDVDDVVQVRGHLVQPLFRELFQGLGELHVTAGVVDLHGVLLKGAGWPGFRKSGAGTGRDPLSASALGSWRNFEFLPVLIHGATGHLDAIPFEQSGDGFVGKGLGGILGLHEDLDSVFHHSG